MKFIDLEKKYFSNNNVIKILSMIIAILIFFTINSNIFEEYYTTTEYADNIPLNIIYDEENYIIYDYPETISVKITGSDSSVSSAMKQIDSLEANIEVDVPTQGKVDLNLQRDVDFNTRLGDVTLLPVDESLSLQVQKREEKDVTINYEYVNGGNFESGYTLEEPELSQTTVRVSGGSQEIQKVDRVDALIDISKINGKTSGEEEMNAPLVAYDSTGNVVDVDMDIEKVKVTQKFTTNVTVLPVTFNFKNIPDDLYVTGVCKDLTIEECKQVDFSMQEPLQVEVYGNKSQIESMQEVEYVIDLSDANDSEALTINAEISLPDEVYTYDKNNEIEVVVIREEGKTTTFDNVRVNNENVNENISVKAKTPEDAFVSVKVTGASSVVDQIDASSEITVYIDLDGIKQSGDYTLPLKTSSVYDYIDLELSKDEINIEVTKGE